MNNNFNVASLWTLDPNQLGNTQVAANSPLMGPTPMMPIVQGPIDTKALKQPAKQINYPPQEMVARKPQGTLNQDSFDQAFADSMGNRAINVQEMKARLEKEMQNQPGWFESANLKPLMALADQTMGSNMAAAYQPTNAQATHEAKLKQLRDGIAQQEGSLSDDQLGYLKNKLSEQNQDKRLQMQLAAQERAMAKSSQSQTNGLRGEWLKNPLTKATQDVAVAYEKVESAASDPSAAGDLSLIFGYMKMLDPGSTVREGEFANAQNAAGVPDQIQNLWNRAQKGTRLNPNQRADFLNQARKVYQSQMAQQERFDSSYSDLATRSGFSPEDVVLSKSLFKSSAPKAGGSVTSKAAPNFDTMSIEELQKYNAGN